MADKWKTFIPISSPSIGSQEIRDVVSVLKSGWIGTGKHTMEFEKQFEEYVKARYAISTNSCTASLHLSLLAHGIKKGDEVITTPMTFIATANTILMVGATPILVDIDPATLNMNPALIEQVITSRTRVIIPVHYAGLPVDLKPINEIAKKYSLDVIEDAAHAVGSEYMGKKIGNHGNTVCFSFYPTKNMTTIEGGMVIEPNKSVAEKLQSMRLHGLSADAWNRFRTKKVIGIEAAQLGYKYNMTDIQAVIGKHQLKKLDGFNRKRKKLVKIYKKELSGISSLRFLEAPDEKKFKTNHHFFTVIYSGKKPGRDAIIVKLRDMNIGVGMHYKALHLQRFFMDRVRYKVKNLDNATEVSHKILTLPLSHNMTEEQVYFISEKLKKLLTK